MVWLNVKRDPTDQGSGGPMVIAFEALNVGRASRDDPHVAARGINLAMSQIHSGASYKNNCSIDTSGVRPSPNTTV
jgi:hypothetical protein